jgi:hypothetical protein
MSVLPPPVHEPLPVYISANLPSTSVASLFDRIYEECPEVRANLKGLRLKTELHVTLMFLGGSLSAKDQARFSELMALCAAGTTVEIQVKSVVVVPGALCTAVVEISGMAEHLLPPGHVLHITLALGPSIKPKTAGTAAAVALKLRGCEGKDTSEFLGPFRVQGIPNAVPIILMYDCSNIDVADCPISRFPATTLNFQEAPQLGGGNYRTQRGGGFFGARPTSGWKRQGFS